MNVFSENHLADSGLAAELPARLREGQFDAALASISRLCGYMALIAALCALAALLF